MPGIFTKIINREIPGYIVAEDEYHIAFLDINPLVIGHTLVVPKKEVDYIFNIEDDLFTKLHLFSKKVALAIQQSVNCVRIGTSVIGLEVPHAHIHLIPIKTMNDMNFSNSKLSIPSNQMQAIADKIAKNFRFSQQ